MICVVQRVSSARVIVENKSVGAIDAGLLSFVALFPDDGRQDLEYIADRLRHLRIFADPSGRMNLSVEDVDGAILLVPQFTLAADTRRGRRPSFSRAAAPAQAAALFAELVDLVGEGPVPVESGEFAAHMRVELVNDGPVTLILDSREGRPTMGRP